MPGEMSIEHRYTGSYATLVGRLLNDTRHGWSIGTFGAVGEFVRDDDEPATRTITPSEQCLYTARAAIRINLDVEPYMLAYDTLSGDGESWGHSLAFCLPIPDGARRGVIQSLGHDSDAVRDEDRDAAIFDLGAGIGHVRFCLRTRDTRLIDTLLALQNQDVFGPHGGTLMADVMRAQPHRVLISPAGRIEVFAAIPPPDGESPEGPHTHLLPQLIQSGRTHDANAPIPRGFQPVLMFNPRSPWRDALGRRVPFEAELDADFRKLLDHHGLPDETCIRAGVEAAVASGIRPDAFAWPTTRRGRAVARLTLRRIAQRSPGDLVAAWRAHHDHAEEE